MAMRTLGIGHRGTAWHVVAEYDVQRGEALSICGEIFEPQIIVSVDVSHKAICGQCQRSLRGMYGWRSNVSE